MPLGPGPLGPGPGRWAQGGILYSREVGGYMVTLELCDPKKELELFTDISP